MARHSRRKILGIIGTIATGSFYLGTQPNSSTAAVDVDGLTIPDEDLETNQEIENIKVSVDATYDWNSTVKPSRAVLRLKAKTDGDFRQIDAITLPLEATGNGTTQLSGSLSELDGMGSLRPNERGRTNTVDVSFKLILQLYHKGREVATADSIESTQISATRRSVSVEASVGGNGKIEIETATA